MTSPSSIPSIPTDTSYAAKAAYSSSSFFLVVGERLVELLEGVYPNGFHSAGMSSRREKPPLAMVTIFQFIEKLSDSQAVEATRTRVDWKYALHLSMNYPGPSAATLCEYRQWALQDSVRQQRIQLILDRLVETGLWMGYQNQPAKVDKVLDEVCSVTRLDSISQAMQLAIETLAIHKPEWLRKIALPHWYERYPRLPTPTILPNTKESRESFARSIGVDAKTLLDALRSFPSQGSPLAEVLDLEKVLNQNFEDQDGDLSWRETGCANCQQ